MWRYLFLTIIFISSTACQTATGRYAQAHDGPPVMERDVTHIPNAVPKVEPKSRYGNPARYSVHGKQYTVMPSSKNYRAVGFASWYGRKFQNYRTSSGEPYDMFAMTAAHRSLPLPTYVKVTNLANGRHVIVKVNDRGPFHDERIMDLSYAAAKKLGITAKGTGRVEIVALDPMSYPTTSDESDTFPHFYIQIGAFREESNAQKLINRLHYFIEKPIKLERISDNQPYFRVKVGPLRSLKVAENLRNMMKTHGVIDTLTVLR